MRREGLKVRDFLRKSRASIRKNRGNLRKLRGKIVGNYDVLLGLYC
jgi:hypothetical protein